MNNNGGRFSADRFESIPSSPAPSGRDRDGDPWGVLIAISDKAKTRPQGTQIFLHDDEHVFGRLVKDPCGRFESPNVSGKHCTIFRKKISSEEENGQGLVSMAHENWVVYVKDSSSNGTFVNGQRFKKGSPATRIKSGDVISLVNAPEHENAFAFVYQELTTNPQTPNVHHPSVSPVSVLKRKYLNDGFDGAGEPNTSYNIHRKGLGIGGPDGTVWLDDVKRLQRSNEELRTQLEAHLLTIERLSAESRAASLRHDAVVKEVRESLSATFLHQIQELQANLVKKDSELERLNLLSSQQQMQLEDRDLSLAAAIQSHKDADEVIKNQKLNLLELKEQLEDERIQRRTEREKSELDLKSMVERVRCEALEEQKRQSELWAQQLQERAETINKLQEVDKENRSLIETLHTKLNASRQRLVEAERVNRTLELRLQDEEVALAIAQKKIAEKEKELQSATEEMKNEKAAKEEALARLFLLEVEIETTIHDLSVEQQRLKGARERIMLRETQLHAFHSTAEEIAALQQKQQDQLKEMIRVLEDGEEEEVHVASASIRRKRGMETNTDVEGTCQEEDMDAAQRADESGDDETVNGAEDENPVDETSEAMRSSDADCELNQVLMETVQDTQMDDEPFR